MTTDERTHVVRDSRYLVADKDRMVVVIENDRNNPTDVVGHLIDISASGAKLRVSGNINRREDVGLRILVDGLPMPMYVDAEVCWAQLEPDDCWTLGCQFQPRLPEEFLKQLTRTGILNRREVRRTKTAMMATAAFDTEKTTCRVDVHNISADGLCFCTSEECTTGAVACVQNDEQQFFVSCRVRWQMPYKGQYLVGCEAIDDQSRTALRDLKSSLEQKWDEEARAGKWPRVYSEEVDAS